ncbi:glutamyl-tRNA reductase [Calidifontibacter terrae]
MSLLVVGLSHRSAPVEVLERAALSGERPLRLDDALRAGDHVNEWMTVSTCNRVEIYADVATFHGAVNQISESLCAATGLDLDELSKVMYAHFEDRAIAHLFSVAAGLDSIAVGESQILGQLRRALHDGRDHGHLRSHLEGVAQQALRVGKRAHAETDIDTVSRSLIERGVAIAQETVGPISHVPALVIGSGAMSALASHTLRRMGVTDLTVVSRTRANAERLAEGVGAVARPWEERAAALAQARFVVSCTGAVGHVVDRADVVAAHNGEPQVYLDLALPRDIDPAADDVPGVKVLDLEDLHQVRQDAGTLSQVQAVEDLVTAEVAEFVSRRRSDAVGPTVAAIRRYAADVVSAELDRLDSRVSLDERDRAQVQLTVHRVVEKLLHTPTVRMKELAGADADIDFTRLVRELFDIDPHSSMVASIPRDIGGVR